MFQEVSCILEKVKLYDNSTYVHSLNVSKIGKCLALEHGLDIKEIEMVEIAGLLHDCGKLMIDKKILLKPGMLSKYEFEQMKRHPDYSSRIVLEHMKGCELLAEIVMEHHERNDGSGYPSSKREKQIIGIAKIISIADSYDAMKTERCYKSRMEDEEIIQEFLCCRHKYDPQYTNTMIKLIQTKHLRSNRKTI